MHTLVEGIDSDSCTLAVALGASLDASSLVLLDLGWGIRWVVVTVHCRQGFDPEDTLTFEG